LTIVNLSSTRMTWLSLGFGGCIRSHRSSGSPNMEQLMRQYSRDAFAEAGQPHAFSNLTPTGRPKTYARHRNSGQALLRLRELQIDMVRRQVAQIEMTIVQLNTTASELEHEIEVEESRTGIRDHDHFAYSMYAKATIARRDKLKCTVAELKGRLAIAEVAFAAMLHGQQGKE
jgi:flagellar FliJ protein